MTRGQCFGPLPPTLPPRLLRLELRRRHAHTRITVLGLASVRDGGNRVACAQPCLHLRSYARSSEHAASAECDRRRREGLQPRRGSGSGCSGGICSQHCALRIIVQHGGWSLRLRLGSGSEGRPRCALRGARLPSRPILPLVLFQNSNSAPALLLRELRRATEPNVAETDPIASRSDPVLSLRARRLSAVAYLWACSMPGNR